MGDPRHDGERVQWLIGRVAAAADHLEKTFLEDADQGLETFKKGLEKGSELVD